MDEKMKGMMMTGMMALCLVLGMLAVLGNSWLTIDEDDGGGEATYSLTAMHMTLEDDAETGMTGAEMCTFMEGLVGGECDGADYSMAFSEVCDNTEEDDEACDMATGGTIGTIGMWGGAILALIMTLSLVLPMAGVDAMDAIPDMANKVMMWGAGALMLVGILGWYFMLGDGDASTGMSCFMAIGATVLGLGAAAMDQFMEAEAAAAE
jgi:hypothetical protein